MTGNKERLDFCRVKKIFDKGFGFLTSIHHEENVFFHFSKISDKETKEILQQRKRGVVYLYYTSFKKEDKLKVSQVWSDINKVDKKLIPGFIEDITNDFNQGHTNLFELAGVVNQLRQAGLMDVAQFREILTTVKVEKTFSVVIPMLLEEEISKFDDVREFIDTKLDAGIPAAEIAKGLLEIIHS